MKVYEAKGLQEFKDCNETVTFIRTVNSMADVMNSRTPFMALRPQSEEWRVKQLL